jgi:hypothetical protein
VERFSKQIAVGDKSMMFEFTRLKNANGVKFFITSKDQNDRPFAFSLIPKEQSWKLMPGSPRWLYTIEGQLIEAILNTRAS